MDPEEIKRKEIERQEKKRRKQEDRLKKLEEKRKSLQDGKPINEGSTDSHNVEFHKKNDIFCQLMFWLLFNNL
jgi:septal ring factor EnvC (AmiA/AmiB activator)